MSTGTNALAATAVRLRDATIAAASAATQAGLGRPARPVLLIDGGSGAGKTTLARAIAAVWPDAVLVELDDLYPGWDGLAAASATVVTDILGPASGYRLWDWEASGPGAWRELPRDGPIIIEGSGALSRRSRALAAYAVWIEADAELRRRRALERDGARFAPFWERWAAQELAFQRRERPALLADEVLPIID